MPPDSAACTQLAVEMKLNETAAVKDCYDALVWASKLPRAGQQHSLLPACIQDELCTVVMYHQSQQLAHSMCMTWTCMPSLSAHLHCSYFCQPADAAQHCTRGSATTM